MFASVYSVERYLLGSNLGTHYIVFVRQMCQTHIVDFGFVVTYYFFIRCLNHFVIFFIISVLPASSFRIFLRCLSFNALFTMKSSAKNVPSIE